ncbi:MAG: DMT family transporter, partial [Candidatus Aenigmarchaeota archaeon]|nr:DMT family transporter [Candidatus Aenigmarchaeota archaeon]
MDISQGIIFGIIAMIGWGAADFFGAIAVRKAGTFTVYLWSALLSVLFFLPLAPFFGIPVLSWSVVGLLLFASLLTVISWLAFYKGFQVGKVSVVSPIALSWPAITVILSITLLKESLTFIQASGVAFAIAGGVMTSFRLSDLGKLNFSSPSNGVKYALLAALGWGIYFIPVDILVEKHGWFIPLFLIHAISAGYILAYSGVTRRSMRFPVGLGKLLLAISGLNAFAYLSYGLGITSEHTAVVAPIIA